MRVDTVSSVCSGFWTVVRTNGSTNAFLVINGINFMVAATDDIKAKKNRYSSNGMEPNILQDTTE